MSTYVVAIMTNSQKQPISITAFSSLPKAIAHVKAFCEAQTTAELYSTANGTRLIDDTKTNAIIDTLLSHNFTKQWANDYAARKTIDVDYDTADGHVTLTFIIESVAVDECA